MRDLCEILAENKCDVEGALARFLDNKKLYEEFVVTAMEDECFVKLQFCMKSEDFAKAFKYAHAMKGVTGNLGLTPLYEVICRFVEELRVERYEKIALYYEAVRKTHEELFTIVKNNN